MMKLHTIRLSGFQSFGPDLTELTLENITYLIGPNGSGKTAALQALCRLLLDPSLRRIQRSDFHVPSDEKSLPMSDNSGLKPILYFQSWQMMKKTLRLHLTSLICAWMNWMEFHEYALG